MAKNKSIKKQFGANGPRLKTHESKEVAPDAQPPIFSLHHLRKDYCISKCDKEEKAAFADALHKLSQLSWAKLRDAGCHGCGYEKIARNAIKTGIPAHITEDVNIIAFRFSAKKPMVGYRDPID